MTMPYGIELEDQQDFENIRTKVQQFWLIVVITLPIICFACVAAVIGWLTDLIIRRRRGGHNQNKRV